MGDHAVLTAVLHNAALMYPDVQFTVDTVDKSLGYSDLFINNPYYVETTKYDKWIGIEYALNDRGTERTAKYGTLCYGAARTGRYSLEKELGIGVDVPTINTAEFFLTEEEKHKYDYLGDYVLINAGFQNKYSTKSYPFYQTIVDSRPDVKFVQMGGTKQDDVHKPLSGVTNLVGSTSVRDLICLIHSARCLISPPSGCVNIASGFPNTKVMCIIGGREPSKLLGYPNVTSFTSTICKGYGIQSGCMLRSCSNNTYVSDKLYPKCMCDVDPIEVSKHI